MRPCAMQCDHPKTQHDPSPEGHNTILYGNKFNMAKPHAQNIHEFTSAIPHTQYGLHAYKKLITQHDPSPEGHEE